jgi:hypothetical protein
VGSTGVRSETQTGTGGGDQTRPSLAPLSTDTLPPPGQTINGTDPHGSANGSRNGTTNVEAHNTDTGGTGSGLGFSPSGNGSNPHPRPDGRQTGDTPNGRPGPDNRTFGDRAMKYFGYLNLEFSEGDSERGESGGIPGGYGTHNWGGWGQTLVAVMSVAGFILMLASGGGIKTFFRGLGNGLKAAARAVGKLFTRQFWEETSIKIITALQSRIWGRVTWKFGATKRGGLGGADALGNITIKAGLVGKDLLETLLHEGVHQFFSPRGFLVNVRAKIGMWGYRNSHLIKYMEEAMAETVGTGSLRAGLAFPVTHGYVTTPRVVVEALVYLGIVGGGAYATYSAVQPAPTPANSR